ncbi:MAG: kinase, partial [Lentisphaeria bacterium]
EACELLNSQSDLYEFGVLLDRAWQLKRALSPCISNEHIDRWYERARQAGALGGKILGAGGGGFLLVFAKPAAHDDIKKSLSELLLVPFAFENAGSQITMYSTVSYSGG